MMTAADTAQMIVDRAEIISDRPASVVIRRGSASLAAQTVRVASNGGSGERDSTEGQEARGAVLLAGDTDFDVQPGDRFTHAGILYRVTFVRPNQDKGVSAEAEAIE